MAVPWPFWLWVWLPLYSRETDAGRCSSLRLLSAAVPSLSLLSSCWSHAHLHDALFNNLPVWPAGAHQRGASPLGSAALAVRSKECSRAQQWREPCCHPMGRRRERTTWWGWSKRVLSLLDDLKCFLQYWHNDCLDQNTNQNVRSDFSFHVNFKASLQVTKSKGKRHSSTTGVT